MINQQYNLNFFDELFVDNFAGGGGASIGIEMGTNRFIDIAINHDKTALAVHELNHPHAKHFPEDVFNIDPVAVCKGRPVGLAWFSPDCRHFSKAKGSTPVSRKIRGLAWIARRWAKKVSPRIIFLENVEEFQTWGPCIEKWNRKKEKLEMVPDPTRKGLTFWAFKNWFERNRYVVEYRVLKACDYGAPTIRKRFFLIARNDGHPIVWPDSTHGPQASSLVRKKQLKPYRTAAECIDWGIPCPSIFMSKEEAVVYRKATGTNIRRPLRTNTLKRIAKGISKYVLRSATPFIVPIANYGTGGVLAHPIDEPMRTITAHAKGGAFALCTPFIARHFGCSVGHDITEPLGTVTADGMGKSAIVAPLIARQFGTGVCHSLNTPLATITSQGGGGKSQLVTSFLAKHYTGVTGSDLRDPMGTITGVDHHSLVGVTLSREKVEEGGLRVAAFLIKYYGQANGQPLTEPAHTLTTKERLALVTVIIKGEPWIIVDIGMRMLRAHELMIAQGFPPTYRFGDISNTKAVQLIGNSVPPPFSEALTRANYTLPLSWRAIA